MNKESTIENRWINNYTQNAVGYFNIGTFAHAYDSSIHPKDKYPIQFEVELLTDLESREKIAKEIHSRILDKIVPKYDEKIFSIVDLTPYGVYWDYDEEGRMATMTADRETGEINGDVRFNLFFNNMENCKKIVREILEGFTVNFMNINEILEKADKDYSDKTSNIIVEEGKIPMDKQMKNNIDK